MSDSIVISIDAMGGDHGPAVVVPGVALALDRLPAGKVRFLLFGDEAMLKAELDRHPGQQERRILPLTVACLIMFAIANLFPIVEIELQGLRSQTTLAGAVIALTDLKSVV